MRHAIYFLDFDDTVYLHEYHYMPNDTLAREMEIAEHTTFYKQDNLNRPLVAKLESLKRQNVKVILLASAVLSKTAQCKEDYLKTVVPGLFDDFNFISQTNLKLNFIKQYLSSSYPGLNVQNVCIIDTLVPFLADACNMGMYAITPAYFTQCYDVGTYLTQGISVPSTNRREQRFR